MDSMLFGLAPHRRPLPTDAQQRLASVEDAVSGMADCSRFERSLADAARNRVIQMVSERYPLFALEIEECVTREFAASLKHAQRVTDEKEAAARLALREARK